jgi:hypothetical protein
MSKSQQFITINPFEIESRFTLNDMIESSDEPPKKFAIDNLDALLDKLPLLEADFVFLYFKANKKQSDIAKIFSCTQAAVSYRLKKAVKRVQFILSIPDIEEDQMRADLRKVMSDLDVEILIGMYKTTCQSWVAEKLGLSQGLVRHRFFKNLHVLKKKREFIEPYYTIFDRISENFNILREVALPQWHHNMAHILMPVED